MAIGHHLVRDQCLEAIFQLFVEQLNRLSQYWYCQIENMVAG